ncbi:MAG: hypothetical protein CMM39_06030, partial [Rhodospirillaceae bacterium]|nr:hypothetical protein [Rhodospirillaceae bacterium]
FSGAYNNLGEVFRKLGRYEEAIVQFNKSMFLNPRSFMPRVGLNRILYKRGRFQDAINILIVDLKL